MITANIYDRVFHLKYKEGENDKKATAFTIEHNDKHYLLTARHTFSFIKSNDEIEISLKSKGYWESIKTKVFFHDNPSVDIAVFPLIKALSSTFEIILNADGVILGQDVFFLGYPFGMHMKSTSRNYPFIKKGVISAIINDNYAQYVYIDGHNNPGFSGGPIVCVNSKSKKMQVLGIISGYVPEDKETKSPVGPFVYSENSGIIEGFLINHAIDIINSCC